MAFGITALSASKGQVAVLAPPVEVLPEGGHAWALAGPSRRIVRNPGRLTWRPRHLAMATVVDGIQSGDFPHAHGVGWILHRLTLFNERVGGVEEYAIFLTSQSGEVLRPAGRF